MNNVIKKVTSYILISLVLIFTILAILAIWDVISMEDVIRKILTSLFVIFISSVVVLFIFAVLIRDNEPIDKN
ncbi:MAG: hypothetical protein GXO79_16705 [Chlorobi bacterium]|nr:hypothetical protein [Chlorobiota bacterium]